VLAGDSLNQHDMPLVSTKTKEGQLIGELNTQNIPCTKNQMPEYILPENGTEFNDIVV
jgi:hypothetical protein